MLILDKYGWPVEKFKGRPITNFIRTLIHGRRIWGNIKDFNELRWFRSKCSYCNKPLNSHNFACQVGDTPPETLSKDCCKSS